MDVIATIAKRNIENPTENNNNDQKKRKVAAKHSIELNEYPITRRRLMSNKDFEQDCVPINTHDPLGPSRLTAATAHFLPELHSIRRHCVNVYYVYGHT